MGASTNWPRLLYKFDTGILLRALFSMAWRGLDAAWGCWGRAEAGLRGGGGSDGGEMARQVGLALRDTPTVELRLDWLRKRCGKAKVSSLGEEAESLAARVFWLLVGGWLVGRKFKGRIEAQMYWLEQAAGSGMLVVRCGSGNGARVAGENLSGSIRSRASCCCRCTTLRAHQRSRDKLLGVRGGIAR